jgi:hypothetical protein
MLQKQGYAPYKPGQQFHKGRLFLGRQIFYLVTVHAVHTVSLHNGRFLIDFSRHIIFALRA